MPSAVAPNANDGLPASSQPSSWRPAPVQRVATVVFSALSYTQPTMVEPSSLMPLASAFPEFAGSLGSAEIDPVAADQVAAFPTA